MNVNETRGSMALLPGTRAVTCAHTGWAPQVRVVSEQGPTVPAHSVVLRLPTAPGGWALEPITTASSLRASLGRTQLPCEELARSLGPWL